MNANFHKTLALLSAAIGLSQPAFSQGQTITITDENKTYTAPTELTGPLVVNVEASDAPDNTINPTVTTFPGSFLLTNNSRISNPGADAVTLNFTSGVVRYYVAGIGGTSTVDGNIVMNLKGGSFNNQNVSSAITEAVIGTAYGASSSVVNGSTLVTIDDGYYKGNVFAGGGATVNGDTRLVINGGTFDAEDGIYGGNAWGGVTKGNSYVVINGGDFSNANVYAGNHRTGSTFNQNLIEGNASLVIKGGTFKNLNAGSTDKTLGRTAGKVAGNTSILIDASGTSTIEIQGNINAASGEISGDTQVTFTGSADKLVFNGNLNGHGSALATLGGNATVSFGAEGQGFSGDFNGTLAKVDILSVGKLSQVNFVKDFDVGTLSVEYGAQVGLTDSSSFDTLSIVFGDGNSFGTGDVLATALSDIFTASAEELTAIIDNSNAKITVVDANGTVYSATLEQNADGSGNLGLAVGEMIPEPSTYAAIIGGTALLFAAWRRNRKHS